MWFWEYSFTSPSEIKILNLIAQILYMQGYVTDRSCCKFIIIEEFLRIHDLWEELCFDKVLLWMRQFVRSLTLNFYYTWSFLEKSIFWNTYYSVVILAIFLAALRNSYNHPIKCFVTSCQSLFILSR